MLFILGAEDTLRDVAAAARFGPGIPECPPLQPDVHQESEHGKNPQAFLRQRAREIGKERGGVSRAGSRGSPHFRQAGPAASSCRPLLQPRTRRPDDDRHLERELEQIGPEHAPKPAQRHVEAGEGDQEQNADRPARYESLTPRVPPRCWSWPW